MAVEEVLDRARDVLGGLPGVVGLVLGGSHARGTADERSDVDLGLYYAPDRRPSMAELTAAFDRLHDRGRPDGVGRYGEWGPWINGGAWLEVAGRRTDVLLRDLDRVRAVVTECAAGRPAIHYQVGHPHGFCTVIYAGEVHHNVPVHDPTGELAELRTLTDPYPPALRRAIVGQFGWEAGFSLDTAGTAADRGDVTYVAGCAYRSVACLDQVLFALNGEYLVNEKGATRAAGGFAVAPAGYRDRVDNALGQLGPDPAGLTRMLAALRGLRGETLALASDRAVVPRS